MAPSALRVLQLVANDLSSLTVRLGNHADQRSVGDTLEGEACVAARQRCKDAGLTLTPAASRRTLEDFRVTDADRVLFVDVKTRNVGASFSMPNLASITRVRKLYGDPQCALAFLFVEYERVGASARVTAATPMLLHEIAWGSLQIQNLGLGQLQLRDARNTPERTTIGRAAWMAQLGEAACAFCEAQMRKFERELGKWRAATGVSE